VLEAKKNAGFAIPTSFGWTLFLVGEGEGFGGG